MTCGKPKEDNRKNRVTCQKCADKCVAYNKKIRDQRLKNKQCVECGDKEVVNEFNYLDSKRANKEIKCLRCYLKDLSRNYLGTNTRWGELKRLYDNQGGRCYYSNLPIIVGEGATLDHTIPSKGGTKITEIKNLKWVDKNVNYMKRDLSEKKFLQLINLIHKQYEPTKYRAS